MGKNKKALRMLKIVVVSGNYFIAKVIMDTCKEKGFGSSIEFVNRSAICKDKLLISKSYTEQVIKDDLKAAPDSDDIDILLAVRYCLIFSNTSISFQVLTDGCLIQNGKTHFVNNSEAFSDGSLKYEQNFQRGNLYIANHQPHKQLVTNTVKVLFETILLTLGDGNGGKL